MSDKTQDRLFIILAIVFSLLFYGIPLLNILGISLEDVINYLR